MERWKREMERGGEERAAYAAVHDSAHALNHEVR
jgi:hypothetical protein